MEQELIPLDPNKIIIFDEFESQLVELEEDNKRLVFDYDDAQGLEDAKRQVKKATTSITAVENLRTENKKPYWDYGKAIDKKAKEVTIRLEAIRQVHAAPIKERKEREDARTKQHNDNIAAFFAFRSFEDDCGSEDYKAELETIENISIGDSWEEFEHLAAENKEESITEVRKVIRIKQQQEKEQSELLQLRQEATEREQKDREAEIAAEAEARAKKEAEEQAERVKQENIRKEREEHNARVRAENEAEEARERKEAERAQELETAQREKTEAEERAVNAVKEAREAAIREQQEKTAREKEEFEKREADKTHRNKIHTRIADAIDDMDKSLSSIDLVMEIADGNIPHLKIEY